MTERGVLAATLRGVVAPNEEQLAGMRAFLARKYGADEVRLTFEADPALVSGFRLLVAGEEIDWSLAGRVAQLERRIGEWMQAGGFEDIIPILRTGVDDFALAVEGRESGEVVSVGDGIAVIDGLRHAAYGEILLFEGGVRGLALDIGREQVGCLLLGHDDHVREGMRAMRTGRAAGVPVGRALLGRVVNALGEPADGQGAMDADGYYPVESEAPAILDRQSVGVPLETGILAIDAMFPIGRGQRELIIGDRQTGKTAIALDTILNQKGKGVLCVYVAVGQKASGVARVHGMLKQHGAAEYTVVVSACASDPAPLQYIAPYAGCAIAEYFMHQGEDVLIVYDDLSKHAVAYRELSLLLERPPGREAFPGDVFYLHARLLERSARLSREKGGGSITALPIVETQAGDVASYIPTNVISITDGQIFLESELFFAGQRPAVSVGLSVSRVGGAAQTRAMKRAAGSIRLDLAQYREIEVFTQFASDLDEFTREQLDYGAGLMELFKQPQGSPMPLSEQVVSLVVAANKLLLRVPRARIKAFQRELLAWFAAEQPDICRQIELTRDLSDDLRDRIVRAAHAFRQEAASRYGLTEAKR